VELTQYSERYAERYNCQFVSGVLSDPIAMEMLLDLSSQVVLNAELQDVLRTAMIRINSIVMYDSACVFLRSPDGGELEVYAFDFLESSGTLQERTPSALEETIANRVFQTGRAWTGITEGEHAVVPICARNQVRGTLGLVRNDGNPYSPGELQFLEQVSKQIAVAVENASLYQENQKLKERLAKEHVYVEGEIYCENNFEEIVGKSAALRTVLKEVEIVAPTDSTVLICGETGTGKELIARALHNLSPRRQSSFIKLNCAALPAGLLESELFGHEKGAFTGALNQRIGRFELANRGTIFLDEVGDIPLELQTKLLRVLQEREFERLGSTRTIRTDTRLIAATHCDLSAMVQEQKFRSDLFYRLNVFPVRVPALRERPEDIPLLVRHFTQYFAKRMNKVIDTITSETMTALTRYPWPGNVRELQHLIERALIRTSGPVLRVPLEHLTSPLPIASTKVRPQTLEEAEREHILAALKETKWVIAGPKGAAVRLGLDRSTVQFYMKKLGIVKPWK